MTKDELIDKLAAERDDLALQLENMQDERRATAAREVSRFIETVRPEYFDEIDTSRKLVLWRRKGFSKNQARALATFLALWNKYGP